MNTYLWYDYETFGANARRDRPAQFAAVRTDMDLNPIGEPINLICKLAADYVPTLGASLITGITPQYCIENGMPEHQFAGKILAELAAPNTIGVGYNSIRFDDEVTRFMLWRNLMDPYGREWQNGCSRWDIIDMVRTAHALRPDGIVWPKHEDGTTSFRLGDLAKANGLEHANAHDALSDVWATIGLARLVKEKQPQLFDHCLSLRKKDKVAEAVNLVTKKPFIQIGSMNDKAQGGIALMMPLSKHPTNNNEVICWDLSCDPEPLLEMSPAELKERLYTKTSDLPEGEKRIGLRTVALNKSPMVFSSGLLNPEVVSRWNIDSQVNKDNTSKLAAISADNDLAPVFNAVYAARLMEPIDVESDLYGGFTSNGDRRLLERIRFLTPAALARAASSFEDPRLDDLVFGYRARNFPQTLTADETARWQETIEDKIVRGKFGHRTINDLMTEVASSEAIKTPHDQQIAEALTQYAHHLAAVVEAITSTKVYQGAEPAPPKRAAAKM